ncbi:MAG: hypothetical protein M1571_08780 [Firmicutes bacterium]|nr:hypothetical protein [Bacillota bacterium]
MPALLKYSFLALGSRLWFLVIYLLFSLISHLFAPALPGFWRSLMLGVWFLFSSINFMIIWDVIFSRGMNLLHLQYQQIPQGLGKLIVSHLVMVFTVISIVITSWTTFSPFASTLMPGGVSLLVAANIFSFSLYLTSISLFIIMLGFAIAAAKEKHIAALLRSLVLFLIGLLLFQADLNLLGIVAVPLDGLQQGFVLAGDALLQTPWDTIWRNVIITTAALILQYMSLIYLLGGGVDAD